MGWLMAMVLGWVVWTAPDGMTHHEKYGLATHVGNAYYPWKETAGLRESWGEIRYPVGHDWQQSCALHRVMWENRQGRYSPLGKWITVRANNGNEVQCLCLDAMWAGDTHPDWRMHGRIIDLTPTLMRQLDDKAVLRGGIMVTISYTVEGNQTHERNTRVHNSWQAPVG
jgi:hypothetical protein